MTQPDQTIEILIEDSWPSHERRKPPPLPARADADLSGQVLNGRYRLIRQLGCGGMGAVYLAQHLALEKQVAIKVLNTRYAAEKQAIQRFVREAKATSRLRHDNIVDVSDFGASGGHVYLVMEYLEGEDLSTMLRRDGPMPWRRVARILLQVCAALQAAHGRRIVHRDIKPSNCFRVLCDDREDWIKVLDFGVAKVLSGGQDDGIALETDMHIVVGTPEYMAPESLSSREIDARVDVYAVGMLGYHLLTGKLPFSRARAEFLHEVCTGVLRPPSKAGPGLRIPSMADAILMRALRPRPSDRFQSMSELGAAIAGGLERTTSTPLRGFRPGAETLVEHLVRPPTVHLPRADAGSAGRVWPAVAGVTIVALSAVLLDWAFSTAALPSLGEPAQALAEPPAPVAPPAVDRPEADSPKEGGSGPEARGMESGLGVATGNTADGSAPKAARRRRVSVRAAPVAPRPAPAPSATSVRAPEPRDLATLWMPESAAPKPQDMLRPHQSLIEGGTP